MSSSGGTASEKQSRNVDTNVDDDSNTAAVAATATSFSSALPPLRRKRARAATTETNIEVDDVASNKKNPPTENSPAIAALGPIGSFGVEATKKVTERYEKLGRIGRGSYGTVYKARDKQSGTLVALKRCVLWNKSNDNNDRDKKSVDTQDVSVIVLREIEALRVCASCPYTVSLLDVAVSTTSLFLVCNYCDFDLADLIDGYYHAHKQSPFTEEACKTLLFQLLSALAYLHDHFLLHRDVKLSNLLYSNNSGRLQLADFGLARRYSPQLSDSDNGNNANAQGNDHHTTLFHLTPKVASLWYRPPEVLLGVTDSDGRTRSLRYGPVLDVWGAGCAWIELLTGKPAMAGTSELDQIQRLFEAIGVPDKRDFPLLSKGTVAIPMSSSTSSIGRRTRYRILDGVPFLTDAGSQLLVNMLQLLPQHRWTAHQALRSPYFTEHPLPLSERQMPRFPTR